MKALVGSLCFLFGLFGLFAIPRESVAVLLLGTMLLAIAGLGVAAYSWHRPVLAVAATVILSGFILHGTPHVWLLLALLAAYVLLISLWARPRRLMGLTPVDGWYGVGLLFLISLIFSLLLQLAPGSQSLYHNPALLIGAYLSTPPIEAAVALAILLRARVLRTFLRQHYRRSNAHPPDWSWLIGQGLLGGLVISLLSAAIVSIQTQGFHLKVRSNNPFVYSPNFTSHIAWGTMAVAVAVVVMAPMAEEILFRGILFGSLAKVWPYPIASLVSALVFATAHMDFTLLISLAIAGLLLNALYHRSRSLIPSTIAHATLNGVSVFLALLTVH